MLVLTRKKGSSIVIAGCITVTITDIDGDKIKLGIVAPKDVIVDREEVHERRNEQGGAGPNPVET